jgi:WhiB family transcriptional regulator, redox-sensing transcriptional regulator
MTTIPPWYESAACRGEDVGKFYPDNKHAGSDALAICSGCGVREQCLEYALARPEVYGTWGGLTEFERKELRRARQRRASRERQAVAS